MARGTWADAVRVREGRRALERRRGDPFVRKEVQNDSASLYCDVHVLQAWVRHFLTLFM